MRFSSAVVLLLAATCVASPGPAAAPVIRLVVYAPPQQDSPVHIVGIEHSHNEIQFMLSNTSDRAVSSVIVKQVIIPPPGCAASPGHGDLAGSGGRFVVLVGPNGKAPLDWSAVHYPKMLVRGAHAWGTPYLQGQLRIGGVYFQDGTTWPAPIDRSEPGLPFDSELVKSAARNCSPAPDVAAALDLVDINEIVFERGSSQASDFDAEHGNIPQLHFRCTLEGPKAVCRMPLETDHTAPPQPGAPDQK